MQHSRRCRDAELLAFEAGCEDYCERSVDEVEWQGDLVYLYLGARSPFEDVVHRGHC